MSQAVGKTLRSALMVALLAVLPAAVAPPSFAADGALSPGSGLFRITTLDTGIIEFDMAISEIRREPRVSVLKVSGFHRRTDGGTRWLMCMVNALTVLRGFEYWTLVYPQDDGDETVLVGFPAGPKDRMADRDPRFASKWAVAVVAPIERGVRLCKH